MRIAVERPIVHGYLTNSTPAEYPIWIDDLCAVASVHRREGPKHEFLPLAVRMRARRKLRARIYEPCVRQVSRHRKPNFRNGSHEHDLFAGPREQPYGTVEPPIENIASFLLRPALRDVVVQPHTFGRLLPER